MAPVGKSGFLPASPARATPPRNSRHAAETAGPDSESRCPTAHCTRAAQCGNCRSERKNSTMGGCADSKFTALTHVNFQGECACGHRDGWRPTGHGHADFLTSLNPRDRAGPTGIRPRRNRPHRVGSFSSRVPLHPMSTRCPDGSVSPGSKRTSTLPSPHCVAEIFDERIASIGMSVASRSGRDAAVRVDSIVLRQCRIRLAAVQRRGSGTEGWLRSERGMEAHETRNASRGTDA